MSDFFDPDVKLDIYRRKLPHWRQEAVIYFVTFRLADSLPIQKLEALKEEKTRWLALNPLPHNERQLHSWKSHSAKEIHKIIGSKWSVWHRETYDRIVRSPGQLARIEDYIRDNPRSLPFDNRPNKS